MSKLLDNLYYNSSHVTHQLMACSVARTLAFLVSFIGIGLPDFHVDLLETDADLAIAPSRMGDCGDTPGVRVVTQHDTVWCLLSHEGAKSGCILLSTNGRAGGGRARLAWVGRGVRLAVSGWVGGCGAYVWRQARGGAGGRWGGPHFVKIY